MKDNLPTGGTMIQYLISACGISVLCNSKDEVIHWIKEFVLRGGTPTVTEVPAE